MRLTLRTLIAWLDDTLTPGEVKEIGSQVAESPFAKELVERVHRVTRQRRLTVPGGPGAGADATDPNQVASYLDNQLPADTVAEFEKTCLTSDVHLAEVASVHQILSLIGHKAKVPPDAKTRMYRLVRGRETSGERAPRPSRPAQEATASPASPALASWSGGEPARRPWLERFATPAAVLGLIALLGLAAAYSLRTEPPATTIAANPPGPARGDEAPRPQPPGPAVDPDKMATAPAPPAAPPEPAAKAEAARAADPSGEEVGSIEAVQGVVLRFNPAGPGWERVEAKALFKEQTRLLNLAPFRNTLKLGKTDVDLVDSTEIIVNDPDKDQAARLDLTRGQILVRPTRPNTPLAVRFEGHVLTILAPPGVNVGVERAPTLLPGSSEPAPSRLRIFVAEGQVALKVGDAEESLSGPAEVSLQTSGRFAEKGRQAPPAWVTESSPTAYSKEIGDQFTGYFRSGRPILSDVVEAMFDPQMNVKRLAVLALGAIGDVDSVVAGLARKGDPTVHRAVVEVLRDGLARGGESAKAVREALVREFDETWGGVTERLIVGFRPEDAKDEATLAKLVDYLATAPGRGTRELALDNLRALTGRDSLEYDPDAVEGKGLKAWQDLVRKKELTKDARPAATPAPR